MINLKFSKSDSSSLRFGYCRQDFIYHNMDLEEKNGASIHIMLLRLDCFSNLDQELYEIVKNLVKQRPVFEFEKNLKWLEI